MPSSEEHHSSSSGSEQEGSPGKQSKDRPRHRGSATPAQPHSSSDDDRSPPPRRRRRSRSGSSKHSEEGGDSPTRRKDSTQKQEADKDGKQADTSEAKGGSGRDRAKPEAPPVRVKTEEERRREVEAIRRIEARRGAPKPKPSAEELLLSKAGGAYIPPAKLRALQAQITDKSSAAYQRMAWDALKKSINGLINKMNVSNIKNLVPELFSENLVRGRGLFARSVIQAQSASPTFTPVYAALVAIINTKLPENGELILKRLILNFRRAYKTRNKAQCLASSTFIAHLVNQQVAHEVLALQILTLLLETPTDDSVEVAVGFLKEVGMFLAEVSPQARALNAIFERLRGILHEGQIDKRVQYMVEVMFAIRKDKFKEHPMVPEGLDLVEEDDQVTHFLSLDEEGLDAQSGLDIFKFDPDYEESEAKYREIKAGILGESSDEEDSGEEGSGEEGSSSDDEEEEGGGAGGAGQGGQVDMTQTDLVTLRRTIYLTIMSSLDFEEVAHKLLKNVLKPGMEEELCNMIVECCSMERSYLKFYGLMAQRFCEYGREYQQTFEQVFVFQYNNIHRLETNKLRNVGKLFAHLLYTDALAWTVLECVRLNEDDTTSSSRIFIKVLFQELAEYMGLPALSARLADAYLAPYFQHLLPRDHPRKTRFAINFFTSIGLGGLTDGLREHLKLAPKLIMAQQRADHESSDTDSSSESDSSSSSSSSTSSSSDSSDSDDRAKKRRRGSKKGKARGSASPDTKPKAKRSRRDRSPS